MNGFAVLLFLGAIALLLIYVLGSVVKAYDKRQGKRDG